MGNWDKDTIFFVINIFLGIGGFIVMFMLNSLMAKLAELKKASSDTRDLVIKHREDVLKNYVSRPDLDSMKKDIIDRMDRIEDLILSIKRSA